MLPPPHSCTDCKLTRADRCWLLRTPCTDYGSGCADRCWLLRTPCIPCVADHANICTASCASLRTVTPCIGYGSGRADRCWLLYTLCTDYGSVRADRYLSLRTPCSYCAAVRADICSASEAVSAVAAAGIKQYLQTISPISNLCRHRSISACILVAANCTDKTQHPSSSIGRDPHSESCGRGFEPYETRF
jgi:hypothetical protein